MKSSKREKVKKQLGKFGHTLEKSLFLPLDWRNLSIVALQKIALVNPKESVVRELQNTNFADLSPYCVHTIRSVCVVYQSIRVVRTAVSLLHT